MSSIGPYYAYGMKLYSPIELPELCLWSELSTPPEAVNSIEVKFQSVEPWPKELDSEGFGFWSKGTESCHYLKSAGAFLVRNGNEIIVDAAPGVEERVLRLSILGPAMGLLLMQNNLFLFHASAVQIGEQAVAFLGNHGFGKSTMAACLQKRGHKLITDDVLALQLSDDPNSPPLVLPSYPQIKLWPDAAKKLEHETEQMDVLHPQIPKLALRSNSDFCLDHIELAQLFVLGESEEVEILPLPMQEAFQAVHRYWYGARFNEEFLAQLDPKTHFANCTNILKSVQMRRLRRPFSLGKLDEVAECVIQAMSSHSS